MKNFEAILRFMGRGKSELARYERKFVDMADIEATIYRIRRTTPDAIRVIVSISLNPADDL